MKDPVKGQTAEKNTKGGPLVGTRTHQGGAVRVVRGNASQMNRSTPSKGKGGMSKRGNC